MNVRDIREALAEALEGLGYRTYDVIPENAQLPCAAVLWPETITYNQSLGGSVEMNITVTVAVSVTDFERAQRDIDAAMSTPGLSDSLQDFDTTAWHSLVVNTSSNVRQMAEPKALAVDFDLTIYA